MIDSTVNSDSQAISWLKKHAFGFSALKESEYHTIMEFSLLWGLFEGETLSTRASAGKINDVVNSWAEKGFLEFEKFAIHLKYFTDRYFHQGGFTKSFDKLHFRSNDKMELVKQVLSGVLNSDRERVTALLIIIYRLRNNLFHGMKWIDKLEGQFANFEHANAAIMAAIETHRMGVAYRG